MSRRAAGQVNQGLACLREGWLSLRKPMYECRSMMHAQCMEISSSLTSASMDSVTDILVKFAGYQCLGIERNIPYGASGAVEMRCES